MATMLRSLNFVRRLNAGGRRLGAALHRPTPLPLALPTRSNVLRPSLSYSAACLNQGRNYVTDAAVKQQLESSANVDDMLREIDRKTKRYGYVFKNDLNTVLEAVNVRGTLTSTQALLLIRCCGYFLLRESPQTRQEFVNRIWEMAKNLNVPLDVSHYNALLLVYLDNETDFSPLEILIEMKEKNVAPNRVTFQRLIEQYCKKGDIAGATKILEHMSEHEIPLNETIFNSLILGHATADDTPSALKILDIMKQANVEPTSRTYSAIMCAHAKKGDITSLQSVLNNCKKNDVIFSDKDILDVVYTLAVNKHHEFLDEMILNIDKGVNYNRNTLPLICKLLDTHEEDAAFKLQKSLVKISNNYSDDSLHRADGYIFLKKLIMNGCDANTLVKYCTLMVEDNIGATAFENALFIAYSNDAHHVALPLLKAMKSMNREVRENYFYPIFAHHVKSNNLQGILSTMKSMITDLQISPLIITVKDYVVPYMVDNNPMNNLTTLLNNNLSFSTATNAILFYLLEENKTHQAVKFLTNSQMVCRTNLLGKVIMYSFVNTKDVNDLITMLHYIVCINNKKLEENNGHEDADDALDARNPYTHLNNIIMDIVDKLNTYDVEIITRVLEGLLSKGLNITQATANHIKKHLGNNVTPDVEQILGQLTSSDLELAPLKRGSYSKETMNVQGKHRNLSNLIQKSKTSLEHKMLLIQEYIKSFDNESVERLMKELEEQNPPYTVGFCASLVEFYSKVDNVDEADKWFKHLHEINQNCKLDKAKILNYANALIRSNRFSDALNVLDHPVLDTEVSRERICEKVLSSASKNCPDQLDVIFNKLKDLQYFSEVTAGMLGPVIRHFISVDNMEKAVEKFKWACETYKVTPYRAGLMSKLIKDEDAKTLQYVTGLCTQIYGESNSLFDLSVCFLECNRPRQARKILETPGLRLRQDRILYIGKSYVLRKEPEALEKFIELVSGLRCDVNPLYEMLLDLYSQENSWQKGLALWTQMQDDNIQPSLQFMKKLENMLRYHNQEIPFAKSSPSNKVDDTIQNFCKALDDGNPSEAKEILQQIPESMKGNYLLQLVDYYLDTENLDAAMANLKDFWEIKHKSLPPFQDTVTNVLLKLKDTNDFENITKIMTDTKELFKRFGKNFEFTYFLNKSFYESNKYEDLFEYMESSLNDVTKAEKITTLLYHPIIALQFLLDNPEFEERLKNFANKAAEHDNWSPLNTLWTLKFLNNSPDADSFFKDHLTKFYSINSIYSCKEIGAWNKFPQLSNYLMESSKLKFDAKRKNAAILLNLLLKSDEPNKYNLALECLRSIVKVVPLNILNKETIKSIEENCADKEAFQALRTEGKTTSRSQEAATG